VGGALSRGRRRVIMPVYIDKTMPPLPPQAPIMVSAGEPKIIERIVERTVYVKEPHIGFFKKLWEKIKKFFRKLFRR
jgi:hypothetical protein